MTGVEIILIVSGAYGVILLIWHCYEKNIGFSDVCWEYGTCRNRQSRRNRLTGAVYFVLYDQFEKKRYYKFRMRFWKNFELIK